VIFICAHGATYHIAPLLFKELGAEVITIGAEPDGLNINHGVGSTHMATLASKVLECGADLGIAFDGDGDRLMMVDAYGTTVDGDGLLYILAKDWQASGRLRGPVVGTVMSNYGLEQALSHLGIDFMRSRVGDRYVHHMLSQAGGVLGGEASGHVLCLDRTGTGDAIISALQVLEVLGRNQLTLAQALAGLSWIPQKTANIRLNGKSPQSVTQATAVQQALAAAQEAVAGHGRAFLRPSGTEPVVRITVEADELALLQGILEKLEAAVNAEI